jgi:hypothetical protein
MILINNVMVILLLYVCGSLDFNPGANSGFCLSEAVKNLLLLS